MSNASTLHRLASDFTQGRPLPARIGSTPLITWLTSLSGDKRECGFPDLAIQLGVTTERPWVGEVAATLRFRLEEQAAG
ncbi:hypothetical protein [Bradyrhizobium sp.]|uniref:hypothetical protein n=1 Tax=Bradyrhizobium sp. TaxID=376 RepID=UPI0025BFA2B1|nr:hypothetical protein [Bradyrhizobium sp.]